MVAERAVDGVVGAEPCRERVYNPHGFDPAGSDRAAAVLDPRAQRFVVKASNLSPLIITATCACAHEPRI